MVDSIKPLYTAHATSTGGRNGDTRSDDSMVHVELSVPKEMGGPGKPGTATPEHLFAAGYAACFGGALDYVAKQHKKDASNQMRGHHRAARRRRLRPSSRARRHRHEPASGRSAVARKRGARKNLPLQPRHPRQRRRDVGSSRGVRAQRPFVRAR